MAAQRIGGTCYFKIDGTQWSLRGSAMVDPTLINRKAVVNIDGSINYTETPKAGKFSLELTTIPGFTGQSLNNITNATFTLEAGNGTTYILQAGFQTGELEIDLVEGKVKSDFEGVVIENPALS